MLVFFYSLSGEMTFSEVDSEISRNWPSLCFGLIQTLNFQKIDLSTITHCPGVFELRKGYTCKSSL